MAREDGDDAWRAVGSLVRVKTTYGEEFEARVFAVDESAGMVVFQVRRWLAARSLVCVKTVWNCY